MEDKEIKILQQSCNQLRDDLEALKNDLTERFKSTKEYTDKISTITVENRLSDFERKLDRKIYQRPTSNEIRDGLKSFKELVDAKNFRVELLKNITEAIAKDPNSTPSRLLEDLENNNKKIQELIGKSSQWIQVLESIKFYVENNE